MVRVFLSGCSSTCFATAATGGSLKRSQLPRRCAKTLDTEPMTIGAVPNERWNNHLIAERQNLGDAESKLIDLPQPARQPVPTGAALVHQIGP